MIPITVNRGLFVCLYTADRDLSRDLTLYGRRIITGACLMRYHWLVGDDPGVYGSWRGHALRLGLPVTAIGISARPRDNGSMRHYLRVVGARTLVERDLYMLRHAHAIHVIGESPATLRAWQYAQSLGVRVWLNHHETTARIKNAPAS